jgi:hypothetical protein
MEFARLAWGREERLLAHLQTLPPTSLDLENAPRSAPRNPPQRSAHQLVALQHKERQQERQQEQQQERQQEQQEQEAAAVQWSWTML